MAKNENKKDIDKQNEDNLALPPENLHTKPENEANDTKKPPLPPKDKKPHGKKKFLLFLFLLLLCGTGFLALQLHQTKLLNEENLQKLQAAYDEKISVLAKQVNILNTEVTNLKNRPIVEHAAGITENQLNSKIAELKEELGVKLINLSASEEEKSETAAPEQNLAQEVVKQEKNERILQEILLASGALIVRDLAEQSANFAYEAEVLQILAQGNDLATEYVRTIRNYANSGVEGKNQLIRNFEKIFAELNTVEPKPQAPQTEQTPEKWYDIAWNWLRKTVVVKKSGKKPVFTPQNDEVLNLVQKGRLQEAVNALKISEKYAKINSNPLNEWQMQVARYLDFNKAVSGLIMNALANIKLKEMEHAAQ